MALRIFTGTSTPATGNAITAVSNDTIIITEGAIWAATSGAGIGAAAGIANVNIEVQGLLAGSSYGIDMFNWSGSNSVTVAASGRVIGDFNPAIYFDGTDAALINYGAITSYSASSDSAAGSAVYFVSDRAYVFNAGTITASQGNFDAVNFQGTLSNATNTLINTGTIVSNSGQDDATANLAFSGNNGASDQVWNSGLISGEVRLDGGNDLYQGGGRVIGVIDGGAGNDTLIGGGFDDTILDASGSNWIAGGGGADTITIGNGANDFQTDLVWGGEVNGPDTSLEDTLKFTDGEVGIGVNVFLAAGYVESLQADRPLVAVISGFENTVGTGYADALIGSSAANVLDGGFNADWLVGAGGADTFRFSNAFDASGDTVSDMNRTQGDRIDLSRIDANTVNSDDQAFVMVTAHGNNAAGQLVVTNFGTGALVELYTNADNFRDGHFFVSYADPLMNSLTNADFIL